MVSTLILYFILTASHTWEFYSIEPVNGPGAAEYCESLSENVASVFRDEPGNMRIVCADDAGVEI